MHRRTALLSAAVALTLAAGVDASAASQVRSLNEGATSLMAEAQQKSQTVRDLVSKLEAGDVIAYIHVVPAQQGAPESGLRFIGASKTMRFVLIQISSGDAADRRLELLGHELQHAAEVAAMPWVTDDSRLQSMMSIVGWPDASTARGYETAAAGQAEKRVRRDVRGVTGSMQ